jgi:ArsR family transcriptional regulator
MEVYSAIDMLASLAHETRLMIFRLLIRHGPQGLAVSQIAQHVAVPAATLSFHLANLQRAGLLQSRRASRQIIYAADSALMSDLMAFLMENCCQESDNPASCCIEKPPPC